VEEISSIRSIIVIPLYYYISKWLIHRKIITLEKIGVYVVGNAAFQAIFGILSFLLFPDFINSFLTRGMSIEEINFAGGFKHEAGLLMNTNVYANFLLLGLFVLLMQKKQEKQKAQKPIMAILSLFGIFVSQSRFAIGIAILFVVLHAIKKLSFRKILVITLLAFATIPVFLPHVKKAFDRGYFLEDRFRKIEIATTIFANNKPLSFFVGVPHEEIAERHGDNLMDVFSDNSFFSIILMYGLLFAIIYFIIILSPIFRDIRNDAFCVFFIFYLLTILFITNCVFWNFFFLYVYPIFWIFVDRNKKVIAI